MRFIILLTLLFLPLSALAIEHQYSERIYQQHWCNTHSGQMEYQLGDKTRVDCLTDKYAVEFDFAPKWHECVGQALYYGERTGKQATCVLIMERGEKDLKYLQRLRRVAYKRGIKTFTMKPEGIPVKK